MNDAIADTRALDHPGGFSRGWEEFTRWTVARSAAPLRAGTRFAARTLTPTAVLKWGWWANGHAARAALEVGGQGGALSWLVADAQQLPVDTASADHVVMSLVLHRLPGPARAVAEAYRALRPGGSLVIKTVAPDDAAGSLPFRLFPTMADAQRQRMPKIDRVRAWLEQVGFAEIHVQRVMRQRDESRVWTLLRARVVGDADQGRGTPDCTGPACHLLTAGCQRIVHGARSSRMECCYLAHGGRAQADGSSGGAACGGCGDIDDHIARLDGQ